jgi:hypothetical protein
MTINNHIYKGKKTSDKRVEHFILVEEKKSIQLIYRRRNFSYLVFYQNNADSSVEFKNI